MEDMTQEKRQGKQEKMQRQGQGSSWSKRQKNKGNEIKDWSQNAVLWK